jgi:hypothetical protein
MEPKPKLSRKQKNRLKWAIDKRKFVSLRLSIGVPLSLLELKAGVCRYCGKKALRGEDTCRECS